MKINFDSRQDYQLEAITSITDLFVGQVSAEGRIEVADQYKTIAFANVLTLSDATLLENLHSVQERNGLALSETLEGLNFTVEMETGTGKTYVYLRTLLELHQRYGFKKFIIVVPSVAIREGVLKSLELMREHFAELYNNVPYKPFVYDSKRLSQTYNFAVDNTLQIMIMNIDAFNKDSNVIRQDNDSPSGLTPLEFIQETQPIVIIDEPQNMESDKAKEAIATLEPLCTLRYSATHKNLYNLVYKLDPVKAYDLRLVKMIQVTSVVEDDAFNKPHIAIKGFKTSKTKPPTVQLELDVRQADGPKRKVVTIKQDDDLREKTDRDLYEGYTVTEIHAGEEYVSFSNGITLTLGESHGANKDDILRAQVRETVKEHLDRELRVQRLPQGQRLKILSLFFIDRVANYVSQDGKIRTWFIEAYEELRTLSKYRTLTLPPVEQVHNGYFSTERGEAKDTTGKTKADDEAYRLIMKDKDELLDLATPLRFIFSHSALREGWDNPNIFQICTLNESRSEMRKRQEIGRGLRLPVLEDGNRSFDETINILTVVANESYLEFARAYQKELSDETGVDGSKVKVENTRDRETAQLNKRVYLSPEFKELWERIKHKTRYAVNYDTKELIRETAKAIKDLPPVSRANITIRTGRLKTLADDPDLFASRTESQGAQAFPIPDVLSLMQRETELTRTTLAAIIKESGRAESLLINPQEFIDGALRCIQNVLEAFMVNGIKYEKIEGEFFEMQLFESKELEGYLSKMLAVQNSVHDFIVYDSEVERNFAETLDKRTDIKCFVKLPKWFNVETPIGKYEPDWAIVKENTDRLYLVRETKNTKDQAKLRSSENQKIKCGSAHFGVLGVDFAVVSDPAEI
jgi:type III restriction enzyme